MERKRGAGSRGCPVSRHASDARTRQQARARARVHTRTHARPVPAPRGQRKQTDCLSLTCWHCNPILAVGLWLPPDLKCLYWDTCL